MNILYINSLIFRKGSSCAIRNIAMVKGLLAAGNSVDVLTIQLPENLIDTQFKNIINDAKIIELPLNKFEYKYLTGVSLSPSTKKKGLIKYLKKLAKSILYFPDFDKNWLKKGDSLKSLEQYDLLISSSDTKTSHFMAKNILRKKNIKWIQYWGDPWADDINTPGYLKFITSIYEKKLIQQASVVYYSSIITTELMKNKYKKLAPKMYDIEGVYLDEVIADHFTSETIKLVYTGVLGYGRNIYNLIEAIENLNEKKGEKLFELNIYGSCSKVDFDRINNYSDAIHHYGLVPYEMINKIYMNNDILIFLSNEIGCNQIPAKIYDYYGTNNGILSILYTDKDLLYNFLSSTKRSEICLNNIKSITEKLILFINNKNIYSPLRKYSPEFKSRELISR